MLALSTTTLALSIAPALRPAVVPVARVASPTMVTALTKVKDSIIPANAKDTIQNLYGYQALAWGVSGLCAPAWTAGLIGVTLSAVETTMMQGMALGNLALAGRYFGSSEEGAAQTGFVWFAGWYWLLSNAVKAGTLSGPYVGWMVAWNAIMAISAARRQGGLYQVATNVDVDVVSSVLPRDQKASLRNFVGIQALGWAISGLFFSSALTSTLGLASTKMIAFLTAGGALTNLLLASRVFGGDDNDAAANGVVFFGGWAVLTYLAKQAGTMTAANTNLLILWNAASAALCLKQLL
jgi:hypothetical protein